MAAKRMASRFGSPSRAVPRRSARSAGHSGRKNRRVSRRRRKHRQRNPLVSKNSGPSSATIIKGQIKELVRGSVEETLNELLEKEAESLTQAARYVLRRKAFPIVQ